MTTPRRGWSFSLRTLFVVVTLLCIPFGWAAYHLNWIRERSAFIVEVDRGYVMPAGDGLAGLGLEPPWPLGIFGERAIFQISIGPAQCAKKEENLARARALFPEAEVFPPPDYDQ